ncbi:HNH endonuclease signature motif containing protein [Nocardioides sp.]|uniref:HNH endonuclease signature motif containing protein n=1 Tax=Nocardioides sp. TaxID=35761 RepID=UPI002633FBA2|nr:HNH endonuclease signature motif containing protein [Nocardioides sp.]
MSTAPVLDAIRAAKQREDDAARELLIGVGEWADLHTTGALMPDLYGSYSHPDEDAYDAAESAWTARFGMPGADTMLDLAGAGAPEVSDFAVTELATALGRTKESGRLLVGDVVEAKHRLPHVWARLVAGQVTAWRVRRLAQATRGLSPQAAAFVDAQVAHVVHTVGPAVVDRLVLEATARFDPESTEVTECDTRTNLFFDLDLASPATSVGTASAVSAYGLLDRADAEDLEAAVRALAHQLLLDGSTDTLAVRRAKALGYLARGQDTLPDTDPEGTEAEATEAEATEAEATEAEATEDGRAASASERRRDRATNTPTGPRRTVVLTVHLSDAALTGAPQVDPVTGTLGLNLARLDNHRQLLTADAIRDWCGTPGTQVIVKPVIDLKETVAVSSYEVPDRIAARVKLTRTTCTFPHCNRPAETADLDHTVEYVLPDRGGPPGQTSTENLAPLCRHDHRAKTHPSPAGRPWAVRGLSPGHWLWTSPHGQRYLVHPDGTTPL